MKSLFFLFLTILLSSCKKKLVDFEPNFQGIWISTPFYSNSIINKYLIVNGSNGYFLEFCSNIDSCQNKYEGPVNINFNRRFLLVGKVWEGIGQVKLKIEKFPFINSGGIYECKLTGTIYYRQ
jgi:hypothetical protein